MSKSIFLNSYGSNIYNVIGCLDSMKEEMKEIKYWNVCGNSALILFMKILGFTYEQMFQHLNELKIIVNTINASSLMPEDEQARKEYMRKWLLDCIRAQQFFKTDITLGQVLSQTNIFASFILWSRNKANIMNINSEKNPDILLIDCVLASLTALGFFSTYKIKNTIFTNINAIDCYPYLYTYKVADNEILHIATVNKISTKLENYLGPMQDRENELLQQYCDHNNFRIKNISKILDQKQLIKIHAILQRGEINSNTAQSLYRSGQRQGEAFLQGRDTEIEANNYLSLINAQS